MTNVVLTQKSENGVLPITRRKATRGKTMKIHGYWKGIASTILNKADRRHFLNMMIDAVMCEKEAKENSRRNRDTKDKE